MVSQEGMYRQNGLEEVLEPQLTGIFYNTAW